MARATAAPRRSKAAKKSVTRRLKAEVSALAASIKDIQMVDLMHERMKIYGSYTVEERALPDYRDSLKPSQRRVLHAMLQLGLRSTAKPTKSAKVAGKTTGDFHPHGDASVYGTMVNMANPVTAKNQLLHRDIPIHLIAGQGNWGSWDDGPASPRYTECRLSEYSDKVLLDPDYLAVTEMVPNYLGTEDEPVILPSLLPTVMFNGVYGIAVGVVCNIPPFAVKGVIHLVKQALGGKAITDKDCLKHLEIAYPHGAVVLKDLSDLATFYKTGKGRVVFECKTERDPKEKRKFYIVGLTPDFKFEDRTKPNQEVGKAYRIRADDKVKSCLNESDKDQYIRLAITLKDSVPTADIEKEMKRITTKYLRQSETFMVNLTVRSLNTNDVTPTVDKDFKSMSIPELLNKWCKWRVKLELKMLRHKRDKTLAAIHRLEILRLAISQLDVVMKILKSRADDLDKALAKALKIPVEDAKIILDRPVRSLSKLSDKKLVDEIKEMNRQVKTLKGHIKKPEAKIATDIDALNTKNW